MDLAAIIVFMKWNNLPQEGVQSRASNQAEVSSYLKSLLQIEFHPGYQVFIGIS